MKIVLDKYKALQLKGESRKKIDLPKEAKILSNFKKQIIKDEYKY